jgi:hypothetical protein
MSTLDSGSFHLGDSLAERLPLTHSFRRSPLRNSGHLHNPNHSGCVRRNSWWVLQHEAHRSFRFLAVGVPSNPPVLAQRSALVEGLTWPM